MNWSFIYLYPKYSFIFNISTINLSGLFNLKITF